MQVARQSWKFSKDESLLKTGFFESKPHGRVTFLGSLLV